MDAQTRSLIRERSAVERFVLRHQQWITGMVVVPMSFLENRQQKLRQLVKSALFDESPEAARAAHGEKVSKVIAGVRSWAALPRAGRPPIRTDRKSASSHSVRTADKSGAYTIGMQDFDRILDIDLAKGTVTVEPLVTVGALTSFLLEHDRMLEATLEMEDATMGGLALSQGMTTHSHRCGLVHDTVVDYELVTGAGELIHANESENSDVFHAAGFSHGTLGFVTALELRIVPASRELLVTYIKCASIPELREKYAELIEQSDAFFVEAIVYSPSHAVLIRGDLLTDELRRKAAAEGVRTNHQGRWYKTWFFRHAEAATSFHREFMPMRDYLMRHDRSMCMTMLYVLPVANDAWYRWLFGWMLPPKVTFLKALRPASAREDGAKEQIYQDLAFPIEHLPEMVSFVDERFGIYPLLVYPCRVIDRGGFLRVPSGTPVANHETLKEQMYLNLGIYGVPRPVAQEDRSYNVIDETRLLLEKVRRLGGFQHSYCDVYQTREEFYEMFDERLAAEARQRIGCGDWIDVYDKVQPEIPWKQWSTL